MTDLSQIREHMEVIGADGVHIGTVDKVEEHRIKLTKADSGSHQDHHHYLSTGLIAAVEGNKIRLSANGDSAVLLEEEAGRSEEHTSELQSLMRISYAVFCLTKKKHKTQINPNKH